MREKGRQLLPGCRLTTAGAIDGRTKEAALLRRIQAELTAHCGGRPTASQSALIARAGMLSLQLARLDTHLAAGHPVDDGVYLSWSNSLSRIMARLGPPAAAPAPMDALEYGRLLDARRERERAAAQGEAAIEVAQRSEAA